MDEVEKQNPPSENNTPLYPGHKTNHPGENSSMNPRWQLLKVWKALVIVLTPLVLLPIPLLWREKVKFTPNQFNLQTPQPYCAKVIPMF